MSKTLYVWGRVTPEEREIVEQLAKAMNMKISEFIRYLIIKELEERGIITAKVEKIKEKIRGG